MHIFVFISNVCADDKLLKSNATENELVIAQQKL